LTKISNGVHRFNYGQSAISIMANYSGFIPHTLWRTINPEPEVFQYTTRLAYLGRWDL